MEEQQDKVDENDTGAAEASSEAEAPHSACRSPEPQERRSAQVRRSAAKCQWR